MGWQVVESLQHPLGWLLDADHLPRHCAHVHVGRPVSLACSSDFELALLTLP